MRELLNDEQIVGRTIEAVFEYNDLLVLSFSGNGYAAFAGGYTESGRAEVERETLPRPSDVYEVNALTADYLVDREIWTQQDREMWAALHTDRMTRAIAEREASAEERDRREWERLSKKFSA